MSTTLKKIIKENDTLFRLYFKRHHFKQWLDYKICPVATLKKRYKKVLGRPLHLENPKTLNEKINYLNLYKRHPLASTCADKYAVRGYLEEHGYKDLLVELCGVYESVDEIDFDKLPQKFVLKATHGSGYNIICRDKSKLNIHETKRMLQIWLEENYAIRTLELHYKDIKPRIICEKYIDGFDGELPIDYKVFCINGKPQLVECCVGRGKNLKMVFYSCDWEKLNYATCEGHEKVVVERPQTLEKMLQVAEDLAQPFDYVRVDFFELDGKLLFGELTFTPSGGKMKSLTAEADEYLGSLLKLS